jgi:hypothetical protein
MRPKLSLAESVVFLVVVVMLVAGCGGSTRGTTPGNPSNNTSVCAYTKRVGLRGRVYVQIAVTPVSLQPATCSAFNEVFGGRSIPVVGRMGTGHVYCRWNKIGSSYTIKSGLFASSRTTGLAFCRSFHPGHGFKPYR